MTFFKGRFEFFTSLINYLLFSFKWNRNYDNLSISNSWRKNKAFIISMLHNHNTNRSSCKTPTCLPYKFFLFLLIFKLNTEHFSKILTKIMTRGSLNSSSILIYPCLYCWCSISSWEFLRLCLNTFYNWDC